MNNRTRKGPRLKSCGTPKLSWSTCPLNLFYQSTLFISLSNELIKIKTWFYYPQQFSLFHKIVENTFKHYDIFYYCARWEYVNYPTYSFAFVRVRSFSIRILVCWYPLCSASNLDNRLCRVVNIAETKNRIQIQVTMLNNRNNNWNFEANLTIYLIELLPINGNIK